jgi:hypothetical protein
MNKAGGWTDITFPSRVLHALYVKNAYCVSSVSEILEQNTQL